jgi:hypothetical protein
LLESVSLVGNPSEGNSTCLQGENYHYIDRDGKKLKDNYSRDINAIENGVTQAIHTNIMHYDYAK